SPDRLVHVNLVGCELVMPGQMADDPVLNGRRRGQGTIDQWAKRAARVPGPLLEDGQLARQEFAPTFEALHLAAGGFGQSSSLDEGQAREPYLMLAEQPGTDFLGQGIEVERSRPQDFLDNHELLLPLLFDGESRAAVGHEGGMDCGQALLDIVGIDIASLEDDEVLEPAGNIQVALVEKTEVAGAEIGPLESARAQERGSALRAPALPRSRARVGSLRRIGFFLAIGEKSVKGFLIFLGAAPVALRDSGAAHPDFANTVRRAKGAALGIDDDGLGID